jgi:hypothetical protein
MPSRELPQALGSSATQSIFSQPKWREARELAHDEPASAILSLVVPLNDGCCLLSEEQFAAQGTSQAVSSRGIEFSPS